MPGKDDEFWRLVDEAGRTKRNRRVYAQYTCPICGRTISDSAYTKKGQNFRKHVEACEKKRKK